LRARASERERERERERKREKERDRDREKEREREKDIFSDLANSLTWPRPDNLCSKVPGCNISKGNN
jgi:5-formyltetrahydrofolate cyclo-ligase